MYLHKCHLSHNLHTMQENLHRRNRMNASHATNLFANSYDHISTNGKAPLHSHINHNTVNFSFHSDKGLTLETSAFLTFYDGNLTFTNSFDKTKFLFTQKESLCKIPVFTLIGRIFSLPLLVLTSSVILY